MVDRVCCKAEELGYAVRANIEFPCCWSECCAVQGGHPDDCGVEWKYITWDPEHDLNVRLYRPRHLGTANDARIPVVAYFHGGGFYIGSVLPVVVLSFDYRLAPEHRLPAAHEDGARAMSWLCSAAASDPWLAEAADLARVFVAGDSAGGDIAHHVKVGLVSAVRIRGAILLAPAMSGEGRTRAELECPRDAFLTTEMCDKYAQMALPEGDTRADPLFSPVGPRAPGLEAVEMAPMLVVTGGMRSMLTMQAVVWV